MRGRSGFRLPYGGVPLPKDITKPKSISNPTLTLNILEIIRDRRLSYKEKLLRVMSLITYVKVKIIHEVALFLYNYQDIFLFLNLFSILILKK